MKHSQGLETKHYLATNIIPPNCKFIQCYMVTDKSDASYYPTKLTRIIKIKDLSYILIQYLNCIKM